MRFRICACTDTSSALVGSSQTRKSGSDESARAIEMRCRCPPLNSCGYFAPSAGDSPTWASSAPTRSVTAAPCSIWNARSGSATMSCTRQRGLSEA